MTIHAPFQPTSISFGKHESASSHRDDIDQYLAYDDIEDISDQTTSTPPSLPEPQQLYLHQGRQPITPSRVLKRPMYDPFVGAGQAKISPIFTPRRHPHEETPEKAQQAESASPAPTPLKSIAPNTSSRVVKSICRVLFPSFHRHPHAVPSDNEQPAKPHNTNMDLTETTHVQCCVGCYGTSRLCDKRGKAACSQCAKDGKDMCQWVLLAGQKRLDTD